MIHESSQPEIEVGDGNDEVILYPAPEPDPTPMMMESKGSADVLRQRQESAIARAVVEKEVEALDALTAREVETDAKNNPFEKNIQHQQSTNEERGRQAAQLRPRGPPSVYCDESLRELANPTLIVEREPEGIDFVGRPLSPSHVTAYEPSQTQTQPQPQPQPQTQPEGEMSQELLAALLQGEDEQVQDQFQQQQQQQQQQQPNEAYVDIPMSAEEVAMHARERQDQVLHELDQLEELHGITLPKRFNHTSNIAEMESFLNRQKKNVAAKSGIRGARFLMLGVVNLMEWGNSTFDPIGAKLDGWATDVEANINDYDEILYRVWQKYMQRFGEMDPLIDLVLALAMSGFTYHGIQKRLEEEVEKMKKKMKKEEFKKAVDEEVERRFQRMQQEGGGKRSPPAPPPPARSSSPPPPELPDEKTRKPPPPIWTNPNRVDRDAYIERRRADEMDSAIGRILDGYGGMPTMPRPAESGVIHLVAPPGMFGSPAAAAVAAPHARRSFGLTIPNISPGGSGARIVGARLSVPMSPDDGGCDDDDHGEQRVVEIPSNADAADADADAEAEDGDDVAAAARQEEQEQGLSYERRGRRSKKKGGTIVEGVEVQI